MENGSGNQLLIPIRDGITRDETLALAHKVFDQLDAAESTRTDYKYRIQRFLDCLASRPLDRNSYLEYKRLLADNEDMAVATKNKYLAAARVFLKELNRLGYLPTDITQNIKAFQQDKKHKKNGLTDEEVERIVASFRPAQGGRLDTTEPEMKPIFRLKVLIALLAFQGLRQIEISHLNVKDVDLVHRVAYIRGKGRDDKEPIFLHPETVGALREYIEAYGYIDGPLLRSESNSSSGQRLSTRGIRGIITEQLQCQGINKTVHGFRHYFITRLIKAYKGDLIEVAHYSRHRSLEMLQVYNDRLQMEADLPRFYGAFEGVSFR